MKIILFYFFLFPLLVSGREVDDADREIDLGTISVESTVRFPSVEVIENSSILLKINSDNMAHLFSRVERFALEECQKTRSKAPVLSQAGEDSDSKIRSQKAENIKKFTELETFVITGCEGLIRDSGVKNE